MAPDPKSAWLSDALHDYVVAHSLPLDDLQRRLIAETQALGDPAGMQIAPEQGAFMTLLTRIAGVRRALEVGTFTGYSALAIARGLPAHGRLLCCDVSEEWTTIARRYWAEAGIAHRIELRLAPALDTLRALPAPPAFDLAFVDADKTNQGAYIDEIVPRLHPGGLLLVDNVLRSGRVVDPDAHDRDLDAIRAANDALAADPRLESVMLPIADGLTLARRR